MRLTLKWIDFVNKGITMALGLLLAVMSITIFFQVFSRFFLGIPIPWVEELSRYLMIYMVFLGASIALRYQKLIAVEVFSEALSEKYRLILKTLVMIISIVFFVLLFLKGIEMMGHARVQVSPALNIPMSVPYAAIPLGALFLTMNAVAATLDMFLKTGHKREEFQTSREEAI